MTPIVSRDMKRRFSLSLALCLALAGAGIAPLPFGDWFGAPAPLHAQDQANITPLFFSGVVGSDSAQGRRVLLRWYTVDDVLRLDSAVLYRTDSMGNRVRLGVVKPTRSAAVIKSIFYAPGAEAALYDARIVMEKTYGNFGNNPDEFAQRVVDFLDSGSPSATAEARRFFLAQGNFGFALVEGLGYLDHVDPALGPFVYELWQGDAGGAPVDALGQITLDTSAPDVLPAPVQLREVFLRGRDGVTPARGNNRRIFLNWDVSPELGAKRNISFGYNIYRLNRQIQGGETYNSVREELFRVNGVPILPPSPIEGEQTDQSYIFADDGSWLQTLEDEDLLPVGDTYTYFAVPRDLLGQEGLPSDPLVATVRDTFEPEIPRGINITNVDIAGEPFLEVSWFPVPDADTETYRIYRYQEYINSGKPGPFPPVGTLPEGLIAEVPADSQKVGEDKFHYVDPTITTGNEEQIFWYSVSAVDTSGNEGPISPSNFGVIDKVTGPNAPGSIEVCRVNSVPNINGTVVLEEEGRSDAWEPLFILSRTSPTVTSIRVYRMDPDVTPGRGGEEVFLAEYPLHSLAPVFGDDGPDYLVLETGLLPTYIFEAVTVDEKTARVTIPPPTWGGGSPRARYTVTAGLVAGRPECVEVAADIPAEIATIPGTDFPPFSIKFPCDPEVVNLRLLRSVNGGRTWDFVREAPCDGANLVLADNYHPESLVRARYAIVAVDRHGNQGVPNYLPYDVIIHGPVPQPAPIEVKTGGIPSPGNRTATIRWQGPADAIEFYRIHFGTKKQGLGNIATDPSLTALEFSVPAVRSGDGPAGVSYDEASGVFSFTTRSVDRVGTDIDPTIEYEIQIEAVPFAGSSSRGSRKLTMHWQNLDITGQPAGTLRWAARPLPGVIDKVVRHNDLQFNTSLRDGSVEIPVTNNTIEFVWPTSEPPYMVWRQRTDKPNQPWIAVTPLIEEINRTGGMVDDPFFTVRDQNIWILDNTGIVQNGFYRYYVMTFDKRSHEILGLWGPYDFQALVPGR